VTRVPENKREQYEFARERIKRIAYRMRFQGASFEALTDALLSVEDELRPFVEAEQKERSKTLRARIDLRRFFRAVSRAVAEGEQP
jgi:hypothetical protein